MHLFILGICGTFMAGIAALAREMGHEVRPLGVGSDLGLFRNASQALCDRYRD